MRTTFLISISSTNFSRKFSYQLCIPGDMKLTRSMLFMRSGTTISYVACGSDICTVCNCIRVGVVGVVGFVDIVIMLI